MSTLNGGESEGSNRNWILRAYRQKNVRALPLATKGHPVFDPPCVLEGHSKTGFCSGLAPMTAPTPDNQRKWRQYSALQNNRGGLHKRKS